MASGVVRIIGGKLSSRKIEFPEGLCHPMGERERLALFNSLAANGVLENSSVLDLFAGSGALGLEALSRGATRATFVESNRRLASALKENIAKLKVAEKTEILSIKVSSFLTQKGKFDLIFADPPYDGYRTDFLAQIPLILNAKGLFVLSAPANLAEAPLVPGLKLVSDKKYAGCRLLTFSF